MVGGPKGILQIEKDSMSLSPSVIVSLKILFWPVIEMAGVKKLSPSLE